MKSTSILTLLATSTLAASFAAADPASSVEGREGSKLLLNEHYVEAWAAQPAKLDLTEPDDVFEHVFTRLPKEVMVYPGENYYYWKLVVDGREIWGNIRLPAGRRDRGVVSFGYAEFNPFPSRGGDRRLSRSKYFTKADGVVVNKKDDFTYDVLLGDTQVRFLLNKISQHAPSKFQVAKNEKFIQRTFDESGMQFYLMFNTERNYFFWVLDEEVNVPDSFTKISDDLVVGNRTGFVFWADPKADDRKVLATIRKISVLRNDYYDGPFDQLSDNYVDVIDIKSWIERAIPTIKGRIDKYGYYTDTERPSRVALSNYGNYYTFAEALQFVEAAKKSFDPYYYISRGGVPPRGLNWDGTKAKAYVPATRSNSSKTAPTKAPTKVAPTKNTAPAKEEANVAGGKTK